MIELCGLVGGAATRLFVWGSDYLNKKQQHEQDLERMRAETELERAKADAKLSEALAARPIQSIPEAPPSTPVVESSPTGYSYLDLVNSTVRPALTFWYCLVLYSLYKGFFLYYAIKQGFPLNDVASEFDRTIVASMISYWFTDRTFHKLAQ